MDPGNAPDSVLDDHLAVARYWRGTLIQLTLLWGCFSLSAVLPWIAIRTAELRWEWQLEREAIGRPIAEPHIELGDPSGPVDAAPANTDRVYLL